MKKTGAKEIVRGSESNDQELKPERFCLLFNDARGLLPDALLEKKIKL